MASELLPSAAPPDAREPSASRWAGRWFEVDRLPVMVVDYDGRVIDANPAGWRLMDNGDAAECQAGMLAFQDASAQHAFQAALDTVASGEQEEISTIVRCNDSVLRRMDVRRCGEGNADAAF